MDFHCILFFLQCCEASNAIPLLPKATFTPSMHQNLCVSRIQKDTVLAIQYSPIFSMNRKCLNTISPTLFANCLSIPGVLCTCSFLISALVTHHDHMSAHNNASSTIITASFRHFFALVLFPYHISSASVLIYVSLPLFIMYTTFLSHPPSDVTSDC